MLAEEGHTASSKHALWLVNRLNPVDICIASKDSPVRGTLALIAQGVDENVFSAVVARHSSSMSLDLAEAWASQKEIHNILTKPVRDNVNALCLLSSIGGQ